MRVLIACEESQTVCKAFRERGHEAYSCDIIEPSGGYPEWHILGDALKAIEGGGRVTTMDGQTHDVGRWDLLIAHPPCTDLASSGAAWFAEKQKNFSQQKSIVFFMRFVLANVDRVAVENPVGIMSTVYRKPDQIVQPWMFGHPEQKATCFWLKNLPKLETTNNVKAEMMQLPRKLRERNHWCSPGPDRSKIRSKTFPGIAKAMAEQWGGINRE